MSGTLFSLGLIFFELSLMAFGGGNAILPEMQRRVVEVQHWVSASEFSALFALAQAAPGPNMMIVPLIGWHVAGFAGVLVTSIAKFGPSSLITAFVFTLWQKFKDRPWRRVVQAGLVPVTAGLVSASASVITVASVYNPLLIAIAGAAALWTANSKVHPLIVLGGGALIGLLSGLL